MGVRNIKKQLAGEEDLLLGYGTEDQERHSGIKTITKLRVTKVVDTIEDMLALDTTKYLTCNVTDVDRGGIFHYDSALVTTNDGGTTFNGWVRQYDGPVNVRWFGAKGDWNDGDQTGTDDTAAFKAALDMTPANGGYIIVETGSYKITASDLVLDTTHLVTFITYGAVAFSETPPFAVIDYGDKMHPHEGGLGASERPGAAYQNIITQHRIRTDMPNQQDSIIYVEGDLLSPSSAEDTTTEFAGFRSNMRVKDGLTFGAGIRGYHSTVTGDGGHGKLRGARHIAIGLDGHDGLVNGATISAVRTGIIPISAGGDGVLEYSSGDAGPYPNEDSGLGVAVGPGIRRVIVMQGQEGQERPQFGLLQAGGTQALLPEIASIGLHGGGNGDAFILYNDELLTSIIASISNTGVIQGQSFNSGRITISDDSVATLSPLEYYGMLEVFAESTGNAFGNINYRIGASPFATIGYSGTIFDATTGPLLGTTGTDGNLTVSAKDDGTIDIENRTGAIRTIVYKFMHR